MKQDQIAAWVNERGTTSQKERLAVGLLPKNEVLDAMRENAFAPLDGLPRFIRIGFYEVCRSAGQPRHAITFKTDAATLTERQFERMKSVQSRMPMAAITAHRHIGRCECSREYVRKSLLVTVRDGDITLSREYRL